MEEETVTVEFDVPSDFIERAKGLGLSLEKIKEIFIEQVEGLVEYYEHALDDALNEVLDDL